MNEIKAIAQPIASRYGVAALYLFGSYARGDATEESDIDLLVDVTGTQIRGFFSTAAVPSLGGLYCDLEEALAKEIDLITLDALEQAGDGTGAGQFRKAILKERVKVYGIA